MQSEFRRDIKYAKHSKIIQSIQQDKVLSIQVTMQTVVYNAQLRFRADNIYFKYIYPFSSIEIVRQYLF